ncbi:hypothetical protein [Ammoniphilus sp. YIM 78166]|uniref:hypothetical protein n=1 Tax=Ammoniphilus sp. YIM 78166 TaxID=1644106 RepID=UPI001430521B|nr:hypothetical protein [Ammoniphilus sp. YIM 78166]
MVVFELYNKKAKAVKPRCFFSLAKSPLESPVNIPIPVRFQREESGYAYQLKKNSDLTDKNSANKMVTGVVIGFFS